MSVPMTMWSGSSGSAPAAQPRVARARTCPRSDRVVSTVDPAAGPALDGRVAWSVPLPEQPDGELVVAPDGRVLISTRGFLAMAQPTGEPGWLAPTEAGLRCGPVPLDGELIARAEN